MKNELIITNARIVTRREVIHGSLRAADGIIQALDSGPSSLPRAVDLDGDLLIPGLVEIHTDNLEKHLMPRPEVFWPSPMAALMAHDGQICCAGITTVLDAVFLGSYHKHPFRREFVHSSMAAIRKAAEMRLCRSDHMIHLRCEVPEELLLEHFEPYATEPLVKLVSLNDHTPMQRQWREMKSFKAYHQIRDYSDQDVAEVIREQRERQSKYAVANRKKVAEICRFLRITLASHDDATEADVLEGLDNGVKIAEFPTTITAARKARQCDLAIVAGAPNLVRGGSHSGNVSAFQLASTGLLDALSSDYVPSGLLQAALLLHQKAEYSLPESIARVSANPAAMVGLNDRGRIEPGRRADLVRVSFCDNLPVVRTVWRQGVRVS